MLYPLSYEGGVCAVSCANMASRAKFGPRSLTARRAGCCWAPAAGRRLRLGALVRPGAPVGAGCGPHRC